MTGPTARTKRALGSALDRVGQGLRGDDIAPDVAIAVETALRSVEVADVHDLPGLVRFLRESFDVPATFTVVDHGGSVTPTEARVASRFDALLDVTATGLPPLPVRHAVAIGLAVDRLAGDRTHFDRAHWSLDVGAHAMGASSTARAGRFLYQLVRYFRVRAALELGTGYGVSGLYLLAAMADGGSPGRLDTIEMSEPQYGIASDVLKRAHGDAATVHHGSSREIIAALGELPDLGLVFHDGGHDRDQYVGDFAAFEARLPSGAIVVYDDIVWEDGRKPDSDMRTYEGWTEVRQHERVARAAEVGGKYGLLLLR